MKWQREILSERSKGGKMKSDVEVASEADVELELLNGPSSPIYNASEVVRQETVINGCSATERRKLKDATDRIAFGKPRCRWWPCWHDWRPWSEPYEFGVHIRQGRVCRKCHNHQHRTLGKIDTRLWTPERCYVAVAHLAMWHNTMREQCEKEGQIVSASSIVD